MQVDQNVSLQNDTLLKSLVAITGGIGSGKSSVAQYLAETAHAYLLNVDVICKELADPGESGWLAIKASFGESFFLADNTLDRQKLRHDIFADQSLREKLDDIMHPLAQQEVVHRVKAYQKDDPTKRGVIDVPLLFEADWQHHFAQVVVVYADNEICVQRIMDRDKQTKDAAEQALAAQWPLKKKAMLADHVIDNSGQWWNTCLQVDHLKKVLWPEIAEKTLDTHMLSK